MVQWYVSQNPFAGILLKPMTLSTLEVYSDTDWAGDSSGRRSYEGFFINLVSWQSKKQATVVRSSTETEYQSHADVASKVIWLRKVLIELGVLILEKMTTILCDSICAQYLNVLHSSTKSDKLSFCKGKGSRWESGHPVHIHKRTKRKHPHQAIV